MSNITEATAISVEPTESNKVNKQQTNESNSPADISVQNVEATEQLDSQSVPQVAQVDTTSLIISVPSHIVAPIKPASVISPVSTSSSSSTTTLRLFNLVFKIRYFTIDKMLFI